MAKKRARCNVIYTICTICLAISGPHSSSDIVRLLVILSTYTQITGLFKGFVGGEIYKFKILSRAAQFHSFACVNNRVNQIRFIKVMSTLKYEIFL